jgi:5'-nucleotidase
MTVFMKLYRFSTLATLGLLAACTTAPTPPPTLPPPAPLEVQILALNDFHGNLEPPGQVVEGAKGRVPVGGAAYLATALKNERIPNSVTVGAGDLISASPLISSLFYDEPTIRALSDMGLDLAAVGNHEFDRGVDELKRMQAGGCKPPEAASPRMSCKVEPFAGAKFQYLAANVVGADGQTIFPGTAIRRFGATTVGFIGMTLKETETLVSPEGTRGVRFAEEAGTANALVPYLKAQGADAIVLLIHQGGAIDGKFDDQTCPGLSGDILPILDKLDPAIGVVVSGHTHQAYICQVPVSGGGSRLLTSSGRYGSMVADIRLAFAPDGTLQGQRASFILAQGEAVKNARIDAPLNPAYAVYPADAGVAALVARHRAEASTIADRVVATISAPVTRGEVGGESLASALIADGQLFVARAPDKGGAQVALMNNGGARTDLVPAADGSVTYGQLFAMQPFANNVVTVSLTGADIKALLEQMFDSGTNTAARPNLLMPSANMHYAYDRSKPAGQRVSVITIDGRPLVETRTYRVAVNNFLASGGDSFTVLIRGTNRADAGLDLDVTEAYLRSRPTLPRAGRVTDLTPEDWKP